MESPEKIAQAHSFQTTRWSVIRKAAAERSDGDAPVALAEFCSNYREPLFAYVRTVVHHPQDAEDLVQGFFAKLVGRNFLESADPDRGRLRTFLLTCLKRHMADEYRRNGAAKRGGHAEMVDLDQASGVAADTMAPDEAYHRQWARVILARAIGRLRQNWTDAGKRELFEALRPLLGYRMDEDDEREAIAAQFEMSRGAVNTALYRLRCDYREILLEQVAGTLEEETSEEVLAELRELMALA